MASIMAGNGIDRDAALFYAVKKYGYGVTHFVFESRSQCKLWVVRIEDYIDFLLNAEDEMIGGFLRNVSGAVHVQVFTMETTARTPKVKMWRAFLKPYEFDSEKHVKDNGTTFERMVTARILREGKHTGSTHGHKWDAEGYFLGEWSQFEVKSSGAWIDR